MTAQLSRERLEEISESSSTLITVAEAIVMARMLLAGMGTAVAGFDAATAIRACMEEFPEHVHDIVEECAQIAENTISNRHSAPPAPVAVPDEIIAEAKKLAELHGTSFVVFRNGEEPKCADPTKVVISFTHKGLGYPTASEQKG